MSDLAALNRVVHLSTAASDFTQYAKALMAVRFRAYEAAKAPGLSARVKEILKNRRCKRRHGWFDLGLRSGRLCRTQHRLRRQFVAMEFIRSKRWQCWSRPRW
jgi:hypothetical protein